MRHIILIILFFFSGLSLSLGKEVSSDLPYFEEITKIISPLSYTRFHVFVKPDVRLSIDFNNRKWFIYNVHVFDENGNLKIEKDRYGICADLAVHTYQKLKPVLSQDFQLKFAMSKMDEIFDDEDSNHIVLLLTNLRTKRIFLLDPSFQKYNSIENISGYKLLNVKEMLKFVQEMNANEEFDINSGMPLFWYKDSLISLSVNGVDDDFDEKNFLYTINVNKKGFREVIDIVSLGKVKNEIRSYLNKELMKEFFTDSEIEIMVERLKSWLL